MMKANPAPTPLLKRGIYIFGDESNLTGPANELEFFRVGLRSDKHENRAAIRRCNRYPAVAGFETGVSNQPESKLVQVKSQAPILIANKNCALENTQVRVLPIQAGSARLDPTG